MLPPISAGIEEDQIVQYTMFASVSVLTYDCLVTLEDEIGLIWRSGWGAGKLLFFVTRYSGFIDCLLMLVYLLGPNPSVENCRKLWKAYSYLSFGGIVVAEIIMAIRVYALWGRARRILIVLVFFLLTEFFLEFVFAYESGDPTYFPPSTGFPPCMTLSENTKAFYVGFAFLMSFECVIIFLTLWKVARCWHESLRQSTLLGKFYRDGVLYFVFLFALSTANFVIWLREQPLNKNYYVLLVGPQRVLHSIITARMIMNLREVRSSPQDQVTLTAMEFPRGNINTVTDQEQFNGTVGTADLD